MVEQPPLCCCRHQRLPPFCRLIKKWEGGRVQIHTQPCASSPAVAATATHLPSPSPPPPPHPPRRDPCAAASRIAASRPVGRRARIPRTLPRYRPLPRSRLAADPPLGRRRRIHPLEPARGSAPDAVAVDEMASSGVGGDDGGVGGEGRRRDRSRDK